MSKTLIFLALATIIMAVLSLYVAYRIFKKSMKLMTALMLLGGAVVFIGIVAYPKRARIKREVKKVLSLKDKVNVINLTTQTFHRITIPKLIAHQHRN
jgi:putative effector of murein hydrolase